jgi:hypothetical protein
MPDRAEKFTSHFERLRDTAKCLEAARRADLERELVDLERALEILSEQAEPLLLRRIGEAFAARCR